MTRILQRWYSIGEGDACEGTKSTKDVVDQDELHIEVTDGLIDQKVKVAETVARKLTEDTRKDDPEQPPPPGAVHLNEVALGGPSRSPLSSPQQNRLTQSHPSVVGVVDPS